MVGFPDVKNRKVLIQVLLTLPGASTPTEVLHEVYPRNIMLTSEFEQQNNTPANASGLQDDDAEAKDKKAPRKRGVEDWLLQNSQKDQVLVEKKWSKYLAEDGVLFKNFCLRSRVGLLLETSTRSCPGSPRRTLLSPIVRVPRVSGSVSSGPNESSSPSSSSLPPTHWH